MNDPRRFTPQKVPPIFNDPSRFLGWIDPRYTRVSKKENPRSLIEEIQKIDFDTPLPEMTFDHAGNELLQTNDLSGTLANSLKRRPTPHSLATLASPPNPHPKQKTNLSPTQTLHLH